MSMAKQRHGAAKTVRGTWEYRLIFMVAYPIFLAAKVLERCTSGSRFGEPKSIFAAAKEAADTSLPYAFHG